MTDGGYTMTEGWNLQLQYRVAKLELALTAAAKKFREYEALHTAKGSIDGNAKARSNARMAEMCERALNLHPTAESEIERLLREPHQKDPDSDV